ncbi:amino acid transporter [Amylibacter marinus]|uniref:Amino acid transporter n=1 Tax=Amylibacter marinus TaxID=1475483 RepID=A0ABQ5VSN0_9RHOB|nr:LysE/ArgO family amino acid transporter [Amylibacter marinus]GLQ34300.1 amino acid transporter [Amylibacter marinus]
MMTAVLTGFFTALSLILPIGAQNALVLRQGLAKSHVFWTCMFCALSDAILICAGVAGLASVMARFPNLPFYMTWGGIIFLVSYAALRLIAAYRGQYEAEIEGKPRSLRRIIATLAAVTWLNPHVYLDTTALLGTVSLQFETVPLKIAFTLAAVSASFVFFFTVGYGARLVAPAFKSPRVWRYLDVAIAGVMLAIALGLYVSLAAH